MLPHEETALCVRKNVAALNAFKAVKSPFEKKNVYYVAVVN